MKTLVIYYSLEGDTKLIAEAMAQATGAELLEVKPKVDIESKGFMKYVWGGKQAFMKDKPELLPLEKNPADYDFLIIGTPVWAWTVSPAIRSFLSDNKIAGKKVALFCCCGGQKGKTFNEMKMLLAGNTILGEIELREPLKHNKEADAEKAAQWALALAKL